MSVELAIGKSTASARRLETLATLPVFFKLQGRKAVVAGGSEAAAWKAEFLAATGAEVHVYAPQLDPVFDALIASGSVAGGFVHHARAWSAADLADAAVAVCDAEDSGEARCFFAAARAAGVPVNVIDKPDYCDFQFGSIVNRSPAVIAISTDGAAPILGQAIRRRIEAILPPGLAGWAKLARRLRSTVTAKLAPGPLRRAFWERFVDHAFGAAPGDDAAETLRRDVQAVAARTGAMQGQVTLVGAGPGDAEMLTLKAVRAMQAADVILFDNLVSNEVLELARREARRIPVGKRCGRKGCRQDEINEMMVSLARAGKNVVRLKGGDPMVFGRAGEEIAHLQAAGLPVSVVPGITAALAMAASLGVSLTHRDWSRSVRFVTGHCRNGGLPDGIDWQSIADPATTTIFYMGGRTAAGIAGRLMARGMSPDTPVVVAKAVSRPAEERWAAPLRGLAEAMARIGHDEPVLIGVGGVFATVAQQAETSVDSAPQLGQLG